MGFKIVKSLIEIDEQEEFWKGTLLRKYNVGMNKDVVGKEGDFYDYMLVNILWEKEFMILVNVTSKNIKKGYMYSGVVPINSRTGNFSVDKKGFQHTLGKELEDWYLLEEE